MRSMVPKYTPTVLTIAGSDPYGGAGIQADVKTMHTLDAYAFSVPTALTVQNSAGVKAVFPVSAEALRAQLETLCEDVKIDAVKIGMLANAELVSVVAQVIEKYRLKNIVLDTVLVSSSGKVLLEKEAIEVMIRELFPCVDIITPNIPEVNTLLKGDSYSGLEAEVEKVSTSLFSLGVSAVLLKGGHGPDPQETTDYLVCDTGKITSFSSERIATTHTHGTGCVLSSAIASELAKGASLEESVRKAKVFLTQKLRESSSMYFHYRDENGTKKEPIL